MNNNFFLCRIIPPHLTLIILFILNGIMPKTVNADIYRFVTIDGVETFTDAPMNKEAQVVIKDNSANFKKTKKNHKQKQHDISLEEVVTKAVQAVQNSDLIPGEPYNSSKFEIHLPPVGGRITSTVGMRIDPIDKKWRMHNGIDIAIPSGIPVRPVAEGSVIYSGMRSGYGKVILVQHNNGVITLYAHNSSLLVSAGQEVETDTVIALSGSTGRSTGPHLHFEAWQSGNNITKAFMPGSADSLPIKIAAAPSKNNFRKQILSDGTLLFTNIP